MTPESSPRGSVNLQEVRLNLFHMRCPNFLGIVYVADEHQYFIPELTDSALSAPKEVQEYLKNKGLHSRKLGDDIFSDVDLYLQQLKQQHLVKRFIACSAWLESGEQHWDGFGSFLVGQGPVKIQPAEGESPTLDSWEAVLERAEERQLFRAVLARAVRGFYEVRPMISPLLVLISQHSRGRHALVKLISKVLGRYYSLPSKLQPLPDFPEAIHFHVPAFEFSSAKGNLNYYRLRAFSQLDNLKIKAGRGQIFRVPAFQFVTVESNLFPHCLEALPIPSAEESRNDLIVLSVGDYTGPDELSDQELPGYLFRLLREPATDPKGYFAPDILQKKFRMSKEHHLYLYLQSLFNAQLTIRSENELLVDCDQAPKSVSHLLQCQALAHELHLLSVYRPDEIKHLGDTRWEFNFDSGKLL